MNTSHRSLKTRGFSLPEVALSLGIASIALLTLVSLLPFGLDTLRGSSNRQAEARITQSVLAGYQSQDWSVQNAGASVRFTPGTKTLFFDQTGTELTENSRECCYVVQVQVGTAPSVHGDTQSNQYLRQLRVRITDRPADYANALRDGSGLYRERSTWIALLEKTNPLASL
ncbi:MAG: Verru_Chthon cassette protein B [Verrucomicrobium sp.]|nr:Verru_Chthon cassette protein B [Verrucomicrobium sp.]